MADDSVKSETYIARQPFAMTLLLASIFVNDALLAFPTQNDTSSPGSLALNYKKTSAIWVRQDAAFFDAKTVTSPPDTTKLDRRIESLTIIGTQIEFGSKFGLRLNFDGEVSKRREGPQDPPFRYVDQTTKYYAAAVDLTFITAAGLELFGGAEYQIFPAFSRTTDSTTTSSNTNFTSGKMLVPRFGVTKRTATWTGGVFYVIGKESQRSFVTTASDGSELSGENVLHEPTQIGVFGGFNLFGAPSEVELVTVQAGEGGERSEKGKTVREDFLRGRLSVLAPLSSVVGLRWGVAHQTLAYSNSAFINVDTVPVTAVRCEGVFGTAAANGSIGVIYGWGRDGQSIPEFNAKYDFKAFALTTGLVVPF